MHEKLVQKFSMHHYDPIISGNIDSTDFEIHDKSTSRSSSSTNEISKEKNVSNAYANNTIFVSKLPDSIKNSELEGFFSKYGEIERITIPRNIGSGVNKGYAFIEFKYLEDAVVAYEKSHKTILFGREILVDFVRGKNIEGWVPRRFGDAKGGQRFSGGRDVPHRNEKRDRYSRDYEDDRDDYDDHRHKRYRDYDRKMKRTDRKYYDRRDYDSYHDYDKKYYNDPYYSNERYDDYDRYDRGYYEPFDERTSSQYHDDRRYFSDKRYYQDRRYDDYRYDDRGDRYYDYPYDEKRFSEYGEDPHYPSSDKGYPPSSHYDTHHTNGYGDLDHNGLVPLHDQDKHHYSYPPSSSSYDDSHYNPSESNSLSSFNSSGSLSTSNSSLSTSSIVTNEKFYNQEAKLQN